MNANELLTFLLRATRIRDKKTTLPLFAFTLRRGGWAEAVFEAESLERPTYRDC